MSEKSQNNTASKNPSHIAFQVRDGGEEKKAYFNRIGAAFEHKDGKGYNVHLDAMPVDGRVVLRTPQDRVKAAKDGRNKDQPEMELEHGT